MSGYPGTSGLVCDLGLLGALPSLTAQLHTQSQTSWCPGGAPSPGAAFRVPGSLTGKAVLGGAGLLAHTCPPAVLPWSLPCCFTIHGSHEPRGPRDCVIPSRQPRAEGEVLLSPGPGPAGYPAPSREWGGICRDVSSMAQGTMASQGHHGGHAGPLGMGAWAETD